MTIHINNTEAPAVAPGHLTAQHVYNVSKEFIVIVILWTASVALDINCCHFLLWIKNALCES